MFLEDLKTDIFAGVTLTLTQIAPCVAYAILGGAQPNDGLRVSAILTIGCSVFGGRPGMLVAAAGAVAPLLPQYVDQYGPSGLGAISIATGVIVGVVAASGVARYVRIIPATVMIGFLDGLGITLAYTQIARFKLPDGHYATGSTAAWMAMICIVSFLTMMLLPRWSQLVPSAFAAVVVGTVMEQLLRAAGHGTVSIKDLYTLSGSLKPPTIPDIDYSNAGQIGAVLTTAATASVSACFESFLCIHLLNRATKTPGNFRREGISIGVFNIINGFLSGFPGCAVIGPSLLNADMHAATRRGSSFLCGVLLLSIYLVASPVVDLIPTAALAAVIFGIAVKTFAWESIPMIFLLRVPIADACVILVTVVVALVYDLAIGVCVGCGVACLVAVASFGIAHGAHGWVQTPLMVGGPDRCSTQADVSLPTGDVDVCPQTVNGTSSMDPAGDQCATQPQRITLATLDAARECIDRQVRHVHVPVRGLLFFGTAMNFEDTILLDVERMTESLVASQPTSTTAPLPRQVRHTVTDVVIDAQDGAFMVRDFTAADTLREVASELCRVGLRCHLVGLDAISLSILREVKRLGGGYDLLRIPQLQQSDTSTTVKIARIQSRTSRPRFPEKLYPAAAPAVEGNGATPADGLEVPVGSDTPPMADNVALSNLAISSDLVGSDSADVDYESPLQWSAEVLVSLSYVGLADECRDAPHVVYVPVEFPWHLFPHCTALLEALEEAHSAALQQNATPFAALDGVDHREDCLVAASLVVCFNFSSIGEKANQLVVVPAMRGLRSVASRVKLLSDRGGADEAVTVVRLSDSRSLTIRVDQRSLMEAWESKCIASAIRKLSIGSRNTNT